PGRASGPAPRRSGRHPASRPRPCARPRPRRPPPPPPWPRACVPARGGSAPAGPGGPGRAAPASARRARAAGRRRRPGPRAGAARPRSRSHACSGLGGAAPGGGRLGLAGITVAVLLARGHGQRGHLRAQLGLQALGHGRVLLEVLAGVLLALADALVAIAVPGACLLHEPGVHAHVDQLALAADALAVEDLGDDLLE